MGVSHEYMPTFTIVNQGPNFVNSPNESNYVYYLKLVQALKLGFVDGCIVFKYTLSLLKL